MSTITITAADNEIILIAYQWGNSYPLAHIKSGYGNAVNVTLKLQSGQYSGQVELTGLAAGQALNASSGVFLAAGTYSLEAIGINWGGPLKFAVNVDGTALAFVDTPARNVINDNTVAVQVTQPHKLVVA